MRQFRFYCKGSSFGGSPRISDFLSTIDQQRNQIIDTSETNHARQDSVILNLERACQAAIDTGLHFIRRK